MDEEGGAPSSKGPGCRKGGSTPEEPVPQPSKGQLPTHPHRSTQNPSIARWDNLNAKSITEEP